MTYGQVIRRVKCNFVFLIKFNIIYFLMCSGQKPKKGTVFDEPEHMQWCLADKVMECEK